MPVSSEFCYPRPNFIIGSGSTIGKQTGIEAANYYVATPGNGGSDSNPGTIGSPFATIQKAHDVAVAGNLIYVRGGVYAISGSGNYITFSRSGSVGNLIRLWAYPGEIPIVNGSGQTGAGDPLFNVTGNYWHFKLIEILNAYQDGILINGGSNNIVEYCHCHDNVRVSGSGANITLLSGSTNLIFNNDCHHASANQSSGSGGDGIGLGGNGTGNIVRYNRIWRNHDDGIDLFNTLAGFTVESNWCWQNGYTDALVKTTGNGVGIKLGGVAGSGGHTVQKNLCWHNGEDGISNNSATVVCTLYNNTSYDHIETGKRNFTMYDTVAHILKNNLSVAGNGISINAAAVQTTNSWNNPPNITTAASDFVTTDFTANLGSRKADGSLPDSDFLRLAADKPEIDVGTDVDLPFNGSAPDLGAYER